jgi:N-acetylneuraminic acid mutarotase
VASNRGFAINGKGYVVGGQDNSFNYLSNTYEYDPNTNTWTQKASAPVSISGTFTFVINNIAYLGCGARTGANNSTTMYAYNPATNTWTQKANYVGPSVVVPVGFAIGNYGYAGGGTNGSGSLNNQFYKYDPANDTWSAIAAYPGKPRAGAMAFVINGKAYVGGGTAVIGGSYYYALGDMYEYDPSTDKWSPAPSLPGLPREQSGVFNFADNAFIIGGHENETDSYYSMVSEYISCGQFSTIEEHGKERIAFNIFPNPSIDAINIQLGDDINSSVEYNVVGIDGKLIQNGIRREKFFSLTTKEMANGVYLLTIKTDNGQQTSKRFEVMH